MIRRIHWVKGSLDKRWCQILITSNWGGRGAISIIWRRESGRRALGINPHRSVLWIAAIAAEKVGKVIITLRGWPCDSNQCCIAPLKSPLEVTQPPVECWQYFQCSLTMKPDYFWWSYTGIVFIIKCFAWIVARRKCGVSESNIYITIFQICS